MAYHLPCAVCAMRACDAGLALRSLSRESSTREYFAPHHTNYTCICSTVNQERKMQRYSLSCDLSHATDAHGGASSLSCQKLCIAGICYPPRGAEFCPRDPASQRHTRSCSPGSRRREACPVSRLIAVTLSYFFRPCFTPIGSLLTQWPGRDFSQNDGLHRDHCPQNKSWRGSSGTCPRDTCL